MSILQNYLSKVGLQKHQVDLDYFGNNNSDPGSPTDSEERSKSLVESVSIPALFPANKSDTDGSSESNERPPIFSYCRNSIMSFFSPARSSVSENPSIRANEPTGPSISLLFPPLRSNTETNDSCSEFDEAVEARFPYSIVSFFPPTKSQTDSVSENDDINRTDPSIPASARPTRCTIQTTSFRDSFRLLRQFLRQWWVREFSGRERKHGSNRGVNDGANNSTQEREAESVKFNIEEILEATWNFSPSFKIGQGGFGKVFKGRLKDGTLVAVKRAKKGVFHKHLEVEFQSEIQTLAKVEHLNLVKFYGYLEHGDERIVVAEYVPNGNLREHLDCIRGNILSLVVRLDIAIDVAHAITYLHMYTVPLQTLSFIET